MKIAFLGNWGPAWSTENHLGSSLELLGHEVTRLQEGTVWASGVPDLAVGHDLFVWVQTYGLAESGGTLSERYQMLSTLRQRGIISVGLHLDKWFGLAREDQVRTDAFFTVDYLGTADGGHDAQWKEAGINHFWFPPGVYEPECYLADPDDDLRADVGFVGSWQGHYHSESRHRAELVRFLARTYRGRVGFWPQRGRPAVRGHRLNQLYAGIKVVVGDSCLVGQGANRYWSDRVSETLGRGGFLIHPHVPGLEDQYTDGKHLVTFPPFDWDRLKSLIDQYLADAPAREAIRLAGHEHVRTAHTYTDRMRYVLDTVLA